MRSSRALLVAVVLACCTAQESSGRLIGVQSYQELLDKSDLAVIATPITKTSDTNEESYLPDISRSNGSKLKSIGVETTFNVCVVIKGEKRSQQIVLHHYRLVSAELLLSGPMLVSFDPFAVGQRSSYLLFLVRESDGRYAPTGGQTDPGYKAVSSMRLEQN